jgi:hypothetical protein
MSRFYANTGNPPTLAEYRQLEDAGHITRPLTDPPLGATTSAKRAVTAELSAIHTAKPSPVPTGPPSTWNPPDYPLATDNRPPWSQRRRNAAMLAAAIAALPPVLPAEPRNDPTGTSTTPQTSEDHTA